MVTNVHFQGNKAPKRQKMGIFKGKLPKNGQKWPKNGEKCSKMGLKCPQLVNIRSKGQTMDQNRHFKGGFEKLTNGMEPHCGQHGVTKPISLLRSTVTASVSAKRPQND